MVTRRQWLNRLLFADGALGLRQLATGLPASMFLRPHEALGTELLAQSTTTAAPQYLIYSTSSAGDPVNCNVPGMYSDPSFRHPSDTRMAPTTIALGGVETTAAAVWNTLPASMLGRTSFFHHSTEQISHSSQAVVQELSGAVAGGDMMVSVFARLLQPLLNTIQAQPISVSGLGGNETVIFGGSPQPSFSVSSLKAVLLQPNTTAALNSLQALRDASLDQLSAVLKKEGTAAQRAYLDRYALSQAQARMISQSVLDTLTTLPDDSITSQIGAAAVLVQMRLTPVVVMHIPFGGDNHGDAALKLEVAQHVSGTAAIASVGSTLSTFGLTDRVSFALCNVFGRDNANDALTGRQHNDVHSCAVLTGCNVKPGVVGGATNIGNRAVATAIDPATGLASAAGSIPREQTLASLGKTLGASLGIAQSDLDANILAGSVVQGALA